MRRYFFGFALATLLVANANAETIKSAELGSATWNLIFGAGSAAGPNRSTAFHGGTGISLGLGSHLSLGMSANYTGFAGSTPNEASYFLDAPITLAGYFIVGETLPMAISGGVGVGFSDLPEWQKSNRALTGHLSAAANVSGAMWVELKMIKASTSTGNVTFGFAVLRYSLNL